MEHLAKSSGMFDFQRFFYISKFYEFAVTRQGPQTQDLNMTMWQSSMSLNQKWTTMMVEMEMVVEGFISGGGC